MSEKSISQRLKSYQFRARCQEILWLTTEAAAVEGRCQAQLSPAAYEHVKTQEQAQYRTPDERLDFWREVETRILNGEANVSHQEGE